MSVGIVYDTVFLEHVARYDHPECPERLAAIIRGLQKADVWSHATHITPRPATIDALCTVHEPLYVERLLQTLAEGRSGNLDPDTFFSPATHDAALKAAGGAVELARRVHSRDLDWGFAVVRPPGHHAEANRACGFCMLNNIAVAAGVLLREQLAKRVAIVDWDVHHGNGTQQQFYDNPNVLYISLHQWPHFPGSGLSDETGIGQGRGTTANVPFPAGMGDLAYADAFERLVVPLLNAFEPDHVMVSAGFDAHRDDPLAGMTLSTEAFMYMTQRLRAVAARSCDNRISFYLEGGYHLEALTDSIAAVCDGMQSPLESTAQFKPSSTGNPVVDKTIRCLKDSWQGIF
ncbi:MAG: histone deacetylase [Deltaproteobacteria bacterium]|nr:histone deacetylase [Deltaproteobacteria bacterium]